jgi:hypothetical protein
MQIEKSFGKLPMSFEINRGQADPSVRFLSRGPNSTLFLTSRAAVLDVTKAGALSTSVDAISVRDRRQDAQMPKVSHSTLRLSLVGTKENAEVAGEDELPGKTNYFIGKDPKNWRSGIATYKQVRYRDVYPGIDVVYYGNQEGRLEHDFLVKPGADPQKIALAFDRDWKPRIDSAGDLILSDGMDEFLLERPAVYQQAGGVRKPVSARYELVKNEVRIGLGPYDKSLDLVIDPVLLFSAVVANPISTASTGVYVAVDTTGNIYATGSVYISDCGHPGQECVPGYMSAGNPNPVLTTCAGSAPCAQNDPTNAYPGDNLATWVVKLDPAATTVVYSAYLGTGDPSVNTRSFAISVDANGRAVIGGNGGSGSAGFPTTANAWSTSCQTTNSSNCGFVSILTPDGTGMYYSTFVNSGSVPPNGAFIDWLYALAVDAVGKVYVTGFTEDINWPANGFQTACAAPSSPINGLFCQYSAFVAKFDPSQSGTNSLPYFSYLGGSGYHNTVQGTSPPLTYGNGPKDTGWGIAVDSNQVAYITGITNSTDFPLSQSPFQGSFGDSIAVAALQPILDPSGDQITGIIDPYNCEQTCADAFFVKVDTTQAGQNSLLYSTYLGGLGSDKGIAVALDSTGAAYLTGTTCSPELPPQGFPGGPSFPYLNPSQMNGMPAALPSGFTQSCSFAGQSLWGTAFITKISADGSSLPYSLYYGNTSNPNSASSGGGIAVDSQGDAFVVGVANDLTALLQNTMSTPGSTCSGWCGFVAELSPNADTIFSTFLDGTTYPYGWMYSVALDNSGGLYLGVTGEPAWFTNFLPNTSPGVLGAYVLKLSPQNGAGMLPFGTLDFGNQNVGTAGQAQSIELTSTGSQALSIASIGNSNPAEFSVQDFYGNCTSTAFSFNAWSMNPVCALSVTFTPIANGTRSATLTVQGNGINLPQSILLTGVGVQATTSTTTASSPNPSVVGQLVTFTSITTSNQGTPAGSVTFTEGTTTWATNVPVDGAGQASFSTAALAVGSHTITATFTGATGWATSFGTAPSQLVKKAGTSTALSSSANPSVYSQSVAFKATVTAVAPGAGVPTGTVTFKSGTSTLGTQTLNKSGHATFTTSAMAVGASSVTAVYNGSPGFKTSMSPALMQTVSMDGTTSTLTSSPNPSTHNTPVTFTATVVANAPGTAIPAGTVTFKDGTTTLHTGSLNASGQANYKTSSLSTGTHQITVVYAGTAKLLTSTSSVLVQTVN